MPKNIVDIGIPIDLDKLLASRLLIQAGSGGGKSYAVRKTVETVGNRVQQIIIDPESEFVTLREKFDFVLIGKDGDIPLSLKYAETLAHKLLETNLSAIIDLSELRHHEKILFVKRFLDAIINAPKELWHSCLVYLDEAHIFCPESSKSESASSVIDLCTRGRKRGFAAVLATQRLAKLHKDAAAECLNKFIGRTGLDIDRKRAGDELGMIDKKQVLDLRELEPGEFYGFGPAISNYITKFRVGKVVTTHLEAGKKMSVNPPTPNAVKKILAKLADIPQEAEKELNTKQQLQSEITRLKTQLSQATAAAGKSPTAGSSKVIASLSDKISQLDIWLTESDRQLVIWKGVAIERGDLLKKINSLSVNPDPVIEIKVKIPNRREIIKAISNKTGLADQIANSNTIQGIRIHSGPSNAPGTVRGVNPGTAIPSGEKKILAACAQFPNGLARNQMTVLTGYKRTSRDEYIRRLKDKNYLTQIGEKVCATDEGREALGDNYEPLPTGSALREYWLQRLPLGERRVLSILIQAYPNYVIRDDISEATGYKRTSRDEYVRRLDAKEVIDISHGQGVKASDNLF